MHLHVDSPDGEAKFWLEPEIELAKGYKLLEHELRRLRELVEEHEDEIRDA